MSSEVSPIGLVDRVRSDPRELDAILRSPDETLELKSRQERFHEFASHFGGRDLIQWYKDIPLSSIGGLRIIGLNTALVSVDDQDRGQLTLSRSQQALLTQDAPTIRVLLTHHPFTTGWLTDEDDLRRRTEGHVQLHLCGHTHEPRADLVSRSGGKNHVRIVAAAAHRDQEEAKQKESHGYNFSSLYVSSRGELAIRVWPLERRAPFSNAT